VSQHPRVIWIVPSGKREQVLTPTVDHHTVLERHINNVKNNNEMDVVESILPPLFCAIIELATSTTNDGQVSYYEQYSEPRHKLLRF
jgi:hypothetical protein